MTLRTDYADVSAEERRLLDAWLITFENAWDEKRLSRLVRDLPPAGSRLRWAALIELIKIDIRRRWQCGHRPSAESYLKAFPELGSVETALPELRQAELEARRQHGANPDGKSSRDPRSKSDPVAQPTFPPPLIPRRKAIDDRPSPAPRPRRGTNALIPLWVWLILAGFTAILVGGVLVLVLALHFSHRGEERFETARTQITGDADQPPVTQPDQPKADAPKQPVTRPEERKADAPTQPAEDNYVNPALSPLDEGRVTMRLQQESEVDAVGNARTKLTLKMPAVVHAYMRRMLTHQIIGGRPIEIPLRQRNLIDFLDIDASGSILEDVEADFDKEAVNIRTRERGFAKFKEGRWLYTLASDPKARYELVKKERGRVITLRGVQDTGDAKLMVTTVTITLPEGARDVRLTDRPSELVYQLPAATKKGVSKPAFSWEQRPHLLSALYKLYADPHFPKYWAARSAFHNDGDETLRDYHVRYRIASFSEWSSWQSYDVVHPGQTVVDVFHPTLDPKVRDLREATPATIEVEYEYVRANGEKVRESDSAPTKLLGFNDGVYTDVKLDLDSPWCEVVKGMPYLLASFASGADPVMHELAERAQKDAGGASPKAGDEEAKKFLQSLYDLMRANIEYEYPEGSFIDGVPRQYLKYGRDVLRTKKGTCINTAILYASVAEAAGLDATIIVIPLHAFMGIRLPKSRQLFFVETTFGTTTDNKPFEAACVMAAQNFQKAMQSGMFLLVNLPEVRARGVTQPELANVGKDMLTEWKFVAPEPAREGGGKTISATILDVRKEADVVRKGLRGMAFHVRLRIEHGKDTPCELLVICVDKDKEIVRSDVKGYSESGILMNVVPVTPRNDDQSWEDIELFLPYSGLTLSPGNNDFEALFTVGSDDKEIVRKPAAVPFTVKKGR